MTVTAVADFALAHSFRGVPFGPPWAHGGTIISHLIARSRTQVSEPFLTTVAADGAAITLSYGDLGQFTRRLAGWLGREIGAGAGDVVAIIPRNDIDSIVAILGVLRSGCGALLLSPADPVARLRPQVEVVGAKAVLRSPAVPACVFDGSIAVPEIAVLPGEPEGWRDPPLDPAADALFFGTSGSTAAAKIVAQSHYNAAANAAAIRQHHDLRRGDRILGCLPVHHVNGLHFTIFGTLRAGAHVVMADAFDPYVYKRLVQRFRPRIASVVPSLLEVLLETWRTPVLPAEFGYFVSAAAPLGAATARRVWQTMGAVVVQGYGLTETTNFSATMPPAISREAYRELITEAEIPSVGVAVRGNEIAILRPDGTPADSGEAGEICMRGHNVMTRYAGNAEATAEAFRGGWFHSQDLGFVLAGADSGRRFLVVTGRTKNIAKVGGVSVSLDEMDRVLRELPEVRDAACVSLSHRFYGEEIAAAVVFAAGARIDVRAPLRSAFPAAALPRRVVPLAAIPRTATGKVLRSQLAETLASLGAGEGR